MWDPINNTLIPSGINSNSQDIHFVIPPMPGTNSAVPYNPYTNYGFGTLPNDMFLSQNRANTLPLKAHETSPWKTAFKDFGIVLLGGIAIFAGVKGFKALKNLNRRATTTRQAAQASASNNSSFFTRAGNKTKTFFRGIGTKIKTYVKKPSAF